MRWWRRKQSEQDLERELRADLELEAAEQAEKGLSEEEARFAAQRALGNAGLVKEQVRDAWGGRWIEDFFNDVRFTLRQLRKAPAFAAVTVLSLALGIGGNTAIFTLIDAVLLKSLPVRDPGSLVLLGDAHGAGTGVGYQKSYVIYSYKLYQHLQATKLFEGLCAFQSGTENTVSVRRAGWSEYRPAQAQFVSGNYFDVLGVNAAMGRTIVPPDDSASSAPVAVLSFHYWKEALHGDPSVIGSAIDIGGMSASIIGVAPATFYGDKLQADPPGIWLPISTDRLLNRERALVDDPEVHWLYLMGRLAPGVGPAQAQARLTAALHQWLLAQEGSAISAEDRKQISESRIELTPGGSGLVHMQRAYSGTLRLLLGISIAVLLITCANIANLLLARGAARRGETSLRLALGASRGRLLRQSLTESLTLALAGGALGLWIASEGTTLLIALFFGGTHYVPIRTSPDLRVLAFTLAVSCGAAILFGLLPAMRMGSRNAPTIHTASPGIKGSLLSHRRFGWGAALVVGEVALSLVVLAGAGTFARSLANLAGQQFGFQPERVLIFDIDLQHSGYDYDRLGPLYAQMRSRLNSLPGVKSASFSYYSPFNDCCWTFSVGVEGYTSKPGERTSVVLNRVSPQYFDTLRTRVLLGRAIDERDTPGSQRVAVVNERFVRRFLAGQNPIGKHFGIGGPRNAGELEIVGVVENSKYDDPREQQMSMAFLPMLQMKADESRTSGDYESNFAKVIEVRSSGSESAVSAAVRHELTAIDSRIPVLRVSTLEGDIRSMLKQDNTVAALATFFGLVALLLCCLGLYGLMAYSVQRRTSEIGVRIALGASRGEVIGMVIREALAQGIAGILIGIPVAFAALQLVASQLYGVSPSDPLYSAVAAAVLLVCIALAGFLPARRAAQVDPLIALRYE